MSSARMSSTLAFVLLLAAIAFLQGGVAFAQAPAREGVWILNDLAAAQKEARKAGKPIFVVFRCER